MPGLRHSQAAATAVLGTNPRARRPTCAVILSLAITRPPGRSDGSRYGSRRPKQAPVNGLILRSAPLRASRRMAAQRGPAAILRDASLRDAPQGEVDG